MVLDTSALLAILLSEPEASTFIDAIARAETRRVGTPTLVEAAAVMVARKGPAGVVALDALVGRLDLEEVGMSAAAGRHARDAYARFGKGVGSPGVLNYGDVLAYGVARSLGEPLLFKGDDFARTDIAAALAE